LALRPNEAHDLDLEAQELGLATQGLVFGLAVPVLGFVPCVLVNH